MTYPVPLVPVVSALVLLAPAAGAGEAKRARKVERPNSQALRILFGTYGWRPNQSVYREAEGFRFRLPAGVAGVGQAGVYSHFALAGDCEVTAAYELINVPAPPKGYGSGVGLALDAGGGAGRGSIQRVCRAQEGGGYVLQTSPAGPAGAVPEQYRFVPAATRRGRVGLRRVGKELVFLTADTPTAPLQEIGRLPFTDATIQVVRFFADAGGAATAVGVRVQAVEVQAEEITGGAPEREHRRGSGWWWLLGAVPGVGGLLCWLRRARGREPTSRL